MSNLRDYVRKPRGLGDTINNFTTITGLNTLAHLSAKVLGKKDCGCGKRQETLNKTFPYKNK